MPDPIEAWKREAVAEEGRKFPETEPVTSSECFEIKQKLYVTLQVDPDLPETEILWALHRQCRQLGRNVYGASEDQIKDYLKAAGINTTTVLLMLPFTGGFSTGVRIRSSDLTSNLDDIWYPSADDLIVIDENHQNLLLIAHSESVGWLRLDNALHFKVDRDQ